MQRPSIDFRVLIGEEDFFPLSHVSPSDLLAHYTSLSQVTCCQILGGFAVRVDDQPWNEDDLDEIRMATTWVDAVLAVLRGAQIARVWAWEESAMTLVRRGDALELSDVHGSGLVVSRRIVVPLSDFARALAAVAREVGAFFDGLLAITPEGPLREALIENIAYPWAERAAAIEAALAVPLPPDRPEAAPSALREAIRVDEPTTTFAPADLERVFEGARPLHDAARWRRAWAVDLLLAHGADVEALDHQGETPLLLAVAHRDAAIAARLLAHGASVHTRARNGDTPLRRCARAALHVDHAEMRAVLVAAGAEPDLFCAVAEGDREGIVARVAQAKATPEALTLLVRRVHAETYGRKERFATRIPTFRPLVEALVAAGAPFADAQTTALHVCVQNGDADLARLLLALGADADGRDAQGLTARELAARQGLTAMVDALG